MRIEGRAENCDEDMRCDLFIQRRSDSVLLPITMIVQVLFSFRFSSISF